MADPENKTQLEGDQVVCCNDREELLVSELVVTASGDAKSNNSLPKVMNKKMKRRIKALNKLRLEFIKIDSEVDEEGLALMSKYDEEGLALKSKYDEERLALMSKYDEERLALMSKFTSRCAPLFQKRKDVVTGALEATDPDCDWPSDSSEEDLSADFESNVKLEDEPKESEFTNKDEKIEYTAERKQDEGKTKGIPEFWLTIFKNVDEMKPYVYEYDVPILKKLVDIRFDIAKSDCVDHTFSLTLEFHFDANQYFTNSVLLKSYTLSTQMDTDEPLSYDGPELIKCQGCPIDWKMGKDVTVERIKKTQKRNKGRGKKRTVTKTVQKDSFFNFFSPPQGPIDGDLDEKTEARLEADLDLLDLLLERILVPSSVLYYTGEAEDEGQQKNAACTVV